MPQEDVKMSVIYVIGYRPYLIGGGAADEGGFHWYSHEEDARRDFALQIARNIEGDGYDYVLRAIKVPAHLDDDGINEHLDLHTHLWFPVPMSALVQNGN